jgi:hypothetical protein
MRGRGDLSPPLYSTVKKTTILKLNILPKITSISEIRY